MSRFQLPLPVLAPEPEEFVALGGRQTVIGRRQLGLSQALIAVCLSDPGCGWPARRVRTCGPDRSDRTRSTVCRRNSARYAGRARGIGKTPHANALPVSTEPGQSQRHGDACAASPARRDRSAERPLPSRTAGRTAPPATPIRSAPAVAAHLGHVLHSEEMQVYGTSQAPVIQETAQARISNPPMNMP